MHPRTAVRQAIVAALVNATAAGVRVFSTRVIPFAEVDLPAIAVYATSETTTDASGQTAPRELTRELDVAVVGFVAESASTNTDDALDNLALEIETAMHADPFLAGVAKDSILKGTEITLTAEGDVSMGVVRLNYSVYYCTLAPEPPVLDAFVTADVRTRIVGVTDPTQDGHDTFTEAQ